MIPSPGAPHNNLNSSNIILLSNHLTAQLSNSQFSHRNDQQDRCQPASVFSVLSSKLASVCGSGNRTSPNGCWQVLHTRPGVSGVTRTTSAVGPQRRGEQPGLVHHTAFVCKSAHKSGLQLFLKADFTLELY